MFKGLFGRRTPPSQTTPLSEAVRGLYPSLVLDIPTPDVTHALSAWGWLDPPSTGVALVGPFGDMFFETPDGVVTLDMMEGALRVVAQDREAFVQAIGDNEYRDMLLGDVWVQAAARRGLSLDPRECFDWTLPPVLGGQCSVETVTKTLFVVKADLAAQLHQQVKDLPPGAPITGVTLDD
ncbi:MULTISPECIES: T6SS immunity protein Tdi1 domain-containing protein [unclassified Caulobacter]|uniref:T6SS immunity protein Tdi1 domain-containing protein n=1 Tax=unclassified Caulobacter TaxID=2648921 RepID=UPI0006FA2D32|nr:MULTISPECIES: T6SS immunity protein Tdi1 domain-containing protein [unclassified Caulobacter]KQV58637.1 hypothetical protein ASC62_07580 [Caulobacter sp. Root342]KQV68854.1 hypothetical protein ASC70_08455 [Caulobacter sp. Root343]